MVDVWSVSLLLVGLTEGMTLFAILNVQGHHCKHFLMCSHRQTHRQGAKKEDVLVVRVTQQGQMFPSSNRENLLGAARHCDKQCDKQARCRRRPQTTMLIHDSLVSSAPANNHAHPRFIGKCLQHPRHLSQTSSALWFHSELRKATQKGASHWVMGKDPFPSYQCYFFFCNVQYFILRWTKSNF